MNDEELCDVFKEINKSLYPDFYELDNTLKKSLWILLLAKNELNFKMLTANQIALIIREVMEISITEQSVYNSFNPVLKSGLIHPHEINSEKFYEIMKPGKDQVLSFTSNEMSNVLYFIPGERFKSKRILSVKIFEECIGDLFIVESLC